MSVIFPGKIILGDINDAKNNEFLSFHKVTHVVNCTKEVPNFFPGRYNYCNLNLEDNPHQPLKQSLEQSRVFISDCLARGGTVFVHCYAGVSRSASVVIYYIMKSNRVSYERAYVYVKDRRNINPNIGFRNELLKLSFSG